MPDVFLSYKRDERTAIEQIASRLRALGLTVWFDASMSAGETFNSEIDREARAAKAILVCWSPAARQSEWVNAEAMIGFEQKTLAACYVAGPDNFSAPTPFNATHAEDLRAWLAAPSETHAGWKSILRRIGKLCARADIESFGALDVQAPASELRAWIAAHEASPLFMTVDGMLRARDAEDAERARLEREARERRAREEVERRAREEAERLAREEQERRQRAERQGRANQEREAQAARDTEAARRARRMPWARIIGGVVVVACVIGIMLNAGQQQRPIEEPPVQQAGVRELVLGAVTRGDVQAQNTSGCGSSLWRQDDRNQTQIFQDNSQVALIRLDGTLLRLVPANDAAVVEFSPAEYVDPTGHVRVEVRLTQGAALGTEDYAVTGTLSVTRDDGRAIVPVAGEYGS